MQCYHKDCQKEAKENLSIGIDENSMYFCSNFCKFRTAYVLGFEEDADQALVDLCIERGISCVNSVSEVE